MPGLKPVFLRNFKPLWPYLQRYRKGFAVGIAFLLFTNVFALLTPWILKVAVDDLEARIEVRTLLWYCGLILGAALLQGICRFAMRRILIGLSRNVEYHFRNKVFRHILSLSPAFFQQMRIGDIMSRATSDVEAVRMAIGPGVMHLCNTFITFSIALASMLVLSPGLTGLAFIPMPVVVFLMYRSASFYHRRFLALQVQNARLNTAAQENFSGIRVVKAYNQEPFQTERFEKANREYMKRNIDLARALGFFHPLVGMVAGMGTLIVLWAGGRRIITGEITLGTLVAFMGFFALLTWPTIALGWVVSLVQRGSAAMGRVNEILQRVPTIADPEQPERLAPDDGGAAVEVRRLSFTYPGREEPVLKNVSFTIRPGEKVALVGRTGSGKSTLLHLVPRLWKVADGTIFFAEHDINRLRLSELRDRIGFVPQETFLFSESLEENIAIGLDDPDSVGNRQVEEVARLAQLTPDITEFPEGLRTVVGERGVTLSGGQKQRAAIARALLRKPSLLILDDALSAVDTQTEENVLDGIFAGNGDRTVILVSHRLSTVRRAERILVLEDGELVESGSHEQLMDLPEGTYRHLVEKQLLAEELEREED